MWAVLREPTTTVSQLPMTARNKLHVPPQACPGLTPSRLFVENRLPPSQLDEEIHVCPGSNFNCLCTNREHLTTALRDEMPYC